MPTRRVLLPYAAVTLLAIGLPAQAGISEHLGVQRLRDELPAGTPFVTDPATDAIEALRGLDLALAGADRDPGAAAAAWVLEYAAAFGLAPPDDALVVERAERLRDGSHRVLLRQVWRGHPVHGGDARIVLSASGRLRAVAAGFRVSLAAPEEARISRETAVLRSAEALAASLVDAPAAAKLWVRRDDGADRLAWRVEVPLADGSAATCWVDAADGALVARDEGIANAVGFVYPSDPRQPLAEEPLRRLAGGPGLRASAFTIEDQQYPLVTPLGPDGDYRYAPTEPGFNQVNVYWHCDRFLRDYLGGLGYAGPPAPLLVRVNSPLDPNVALTSGSFVYLGRPIPGFTGETSRCQDIIYHELVHAVLYGAGIQPGGTRREASALHEGLADLLAATFTGDPGIGEWLYLTFPNGATRVDQPASSWNADRYDLVSFGGAPQGSVWANGMILSAALWDLHQVIGSSCDSLVLESLDYLPTLPTWAHLANALLEADGVRHGGRFHEAIVQALATRAIRGAVTMPARIAGPSVLPPGVTGAFFAEPCCGVQQTYRWSARAWCRGRPCSDWRDLGGGSELSTSFEEDTELRLSMTTPWQDEVHTARFIGVRPPTLVVEGPRRVVENGRATWIARAAGMGPIRIQWQRRWIGSGPAFEFLGEGNEMSFTLERTCEIAVTLLDGLQPAPRTTKQQFIVEAFADVPPPPSTQGLRVSQRHDARARAMETTLQMPYTGPVRMVVFDVRGRERARIWDGVATIGTHVLRWDAGALEPGIYLLRVTARAGGTVMRFALLR